jgi:hypothetical protein
VFDLEKFKNGWPIKKSSQVRISEYKSVQKRIVLIYRASL